MKGNGHGAAAQPVATVHVVIGEDDYLVQAEARRAIARFVPDAAARANAVEFVDGDAGNAESQLASIRACRDSLLTADFFAPVKVTWWRGVSFLPSGGGGRVAAQDVLEALDAFAGEIAARPPAPEHPLLVTAPRLAKTCAFAKTLAAVASEVRLAGGAGRPRERRRAALDAVAELAAAEGLTFEPGADRAFVEKAGSDTRTLVSELNKLRTWLGRDGAVSLDMVANVTSPGGDEPELWEVFSAVDTLRADAIASAILRFEGVKGASVMLVSSLEHHFRDLVVVRDALDRRLLSSAGAWSSRLDETERARLKSLDVGPDVPSAAYKTKRNAEAARRFRGIAALRAAHWRLIRLRERFVSGAVPDADAQLGLLLTELLKITDSNKRTRT